MSAILSLRYNIPHKAAHILYPALKTLIKSSISSSGGHPTPAFHVLQDLSTIFEHLQLEPVIQSYICCHQCFFLNGLTESVTTEQTHCQCHNDPNDHDPIHLNPAPKTQPTSKNIYPNKTFHLSTIQKLACPITPRSQNYGNSASTSTIPNSQRFPQI
ncbi:hypothetical protein O181_097575 [Austropuccinia psidii MF-1]|uniref:Uncharacterized protein n=1 Tax=Austropuccinia psidii MF-1 TaxID=1389203 RepID=A0A9Q3J9V2_9BASI|nr:hypothetical protein [Austropuccinia psidii MF-1]